ncbi:unnamed protein product [Thlaspi arvense]|uniref:Glutamyl-tRNA(Gln) amidotransferase subunit C, chloroplastic/mitochondrial n=1 Tax=Thlaspi arvense TaxID=13288 RepID=A0AAU9T307_THLAR|nr:unnamed protein product [Thlaspi arvense]
MASYPVSTIERGCVFNLAMATRALLAVISASPRTIKIKTSVSSCSSLRLQRYSRKTHRIARSFSSDTNPSLLQPPDVSRLAETARISLTPAEIEECEPKIRQVIDCLSSLSKLEGGNLREDAPETFENRDGIRASIPSFEDAYLKVPKVLNKE